MGFGLQWGVARLTMLMILPLSGPLLPHILLEISWVICPASASLVETKVIAAMQREDRQVHRHLAICFVWPAALLWQAQL